MTVNYTTLLKLAQPVTGTESGTWGDYVNNAISAYLDASIAGTQTISTDTSPTLTLTEGTNSATNLGSTSAQYAVINLTGARTVARTITLPSSSRNYIILNNTTGGFATTFSPGSVSVAQSEDCVLAYDTSTSAYVKVASSLVSALSGTLAAGNGGTGITASGTSGNVLTSNGTAWTSAANPYVGGKGQVFTSSGTFNVPTGVTAVKVTVVGAGGNGAATTNVGQGRGGGGGGGAAIKYVTGLTPGGTVTVTVGTPASGTSSFGAFASATGGAAGSGTTGGAGGTGTGDITSAGTAGGAGSLTACVNATGGAGGAQRLPAFGYGVGGDAIVTDASLAGNPGVGYGGGGGGAASFVSPAQSGGAGANGVVIVEY